MHSAVIPLAVAMSALSPSVDDWNPPNLVENAGFETLAETGVPDHWGADPNVYTVVTDPVRSGKFALQYVNSDPKRYVLCSQRIPLEPGKAYEVSVWIKTEDIEGEDSGATICLEWYDADGQYVGGHYPAGLKGTNDWRQLKSISTRVPEDAARCSVTCYVREGMTGTAWWDDVEVRQWREAPLRTMLLHPNYRGLVWPESKHIEAAAELSLTDYDLEIGDVVLRAHLTRRSDTKAVKTRDVIPDGPKVSFRIPVSGLRQGEYELTITLERRRDTQDLGSDSWPVTIMNPAELSRRVSYVDTHNRLMRDGEPFFPLGMYWGSINEDDIRTYADSPFNCLMPYGMPDKTQMDLAQKYGLKVIYSVKDIYYGSAYCPEGVKTIDDERTLIEAKAEEFRDHPALLAWYLNDELPIEYMDRLEAHQKWLEELDPDHPTWVVLYQVGQLDLYRRTFDAIGTDPYPIPGSPARRAAEWTQMTVQGVKGHRPVWMVPQVFNWATYRKTEAEKAGLRPPTLAEMRSMAWQCIANGANGLIFYSFFDLKRDTIVPFDVQWGRVKSMAAEIKDMIPVILSVEVVPQIRVGKRHWLHWTTRKLGGTVYLIAVNDEGRGHRVTFRLPKGATSVRLRGEPEEVELGDHTRLEGRFESFGVNIYEIQF